VFIEESTKIDEKKEGFEISAVKRAV